MIFYFSGAGNSRNVSEKIAAALGEKAIAIDNISEKEFYNHKFLDGEKLGVVCAVHFFKLPAIVERFLNRLTFTGMPSFVFTIVTFGTLSGGASHRLREILLKKGISVDAQHSVRMVDTWTPMFDLSDRVKTHQCTLTAQNKISDIALSLANRQRGNFDRSKLPRWISDIYYAGYDKKRDTSHFRLISEKCTGCGRCSGHCPERAISIIKGKATWIKPKCTICLRCLHNCPSFAIQYGTKTIKHGQFINTL